MEPDREQRNALIVPCPQETPTHSIIVKVVGEDGTGLPDILIELRHGSEKRVASKTGAHGTWTFDGLEDAPYSLCLPALDEDAWEVMETAAVQVKQGTVRRSDWMSAQSLASDSERFHRALAGECIASLAFDLGHYPETVWLQPQNEGLRGMRKSLYILDVGDEVFIPARRVKVVGDIPVDTQVTILRKGVPERLRLRFLQSDGAPRSYVQYHLHVETAAGGDPYPDKVGVANCDGLIEAWIPPNARRAQLTLIEHLSFEEYELDLGALAPIATEEGCMQRLSNLSRLTGASALSAALKRFQDENDRPATGVADEATLRALEDRFLC